jgi:hypothetical protein
MKVTNTEKFLIKAVLIHGEKYDYSLARWEKSKLKIIF